jgi:hypothetical protein
MGKYIIFPFPNSLHSNDNDESFHLKICSNIWKRKKSDVTVRKSRRSFTYPVFAVNNLFRTKGARILFNNYVSNVTFNKGSFADFLQNCMYTRKNKKTRCLPKDPCYIFHRETISAICYPQA